MVLYQEVIVENVLQKKKKDKQAIQISIYLVNVQHIDIHQHVQTLDHYLHLWWISDDDKKNIPLGYLFQCRINQMQLDDPQMEQEMVKANDWMIGLVEILVPFDVMKVKLPHDEVVHWW